MGKSTQVYKGVKKKSQVSLRVGMVLIMLLVGLFNFTVICAADDGAELPFDLDIELIRSLPEVAKSYQELIIATMDNPEEMEIPKEAIKMEAWVYQIKGDPETVLEEQTWPVGIQKNPLERDDLGEYIDELIEDSGEKLTEIWGSDWLDKAKKAANKYQGTEMIVQNYAYITNIPMSVTMISASSPLINFKTTQLYQGTYLIIQKMTVEMTMLPPTNMGD